MHSEMNNKIELPYSTTLKLTMLLIYIHTIGCVCAWIYILLDGFVRVVDRKSRDKYFYFFPLDTLNLIRVGLENENRKWKSILCRVWGWIRDVQVDTSPSPLSCNNCAMVTFEWILDRMLVRQPLFWIPSIFSRASKLSPQIVFEVKGEK